MHAPTIDSSGSRFRALFGTDQIAIVIADDDARYVDANPAACLLFGLPREELLSRRVFDFSPPEAHDAVSTAWKEFRRTGTQKGQFRLLRPDGTVRLLEFSAVANISPGYHASVLRDVTDNPIYAKPQD